jgi:ABC-2 type transport system ATP-binding protein
MSLEQQPALELRGISKRYGDFQAVEPLDLTVPRGATYGLLGPNGAGKTTTIRMALRIFEPDTGEVRILGEPQGQSGLDRVGYLPEERGVYRKMRVRALLSFFAELKGIKPRDSKPRINAWLERMGMEDRAEARLQELSKGMQQKIQFISAILHEPEVVILDEPFSGLDPLNQRVLREIISELKAGGRTIIFSTHIIDHAERICDHIGIIARGAKVADGTISAVRQKHGTRHIAIELAGPDATVVEALRALPGVASVRETPRELQVVMHDDGDSNILLRQLVNNNVRINRFAAEETSLEQIFIDCVSAREAQLQGRTVSHV